MSVTGALRFHISNFLTKLHSFLDFEKIICYTWQCHLIMEKNSAMYPPQNFFKWFFENFKVQKNQENVFGKIWKNSHKYTYIRPIIYENFKIFHAPYPEKSRVEFSTFRGQLLGKGWGWGVKNFCGEFLRRGKHLGPLLTKFGSRAIFNILQKGPLQ